MLKVREAAIVPPEPAVVAPIACLISCLSPTSAGFSYSIQHPPFLLYFYACACVLYIYIYIYVVIFKVFLRMFLLCFIFPPRFQFFCLITLLSSHFLSLKPLSSSNSSSLHLSI